MPPTLPRRTVLRLAGAVAVLPACDLLERGDDEPPAPTPDEVLRASLATSKAALIGRYDAALARHPALAGRLTPLRANHAEHLATLVAPTPTPSPSGSTVAVPADARAAVGELLAAERSASAASTTGARSAAAAELVSLLGSIAACEATHAVVLAQP